MALFDPTPTADALEDLFERERRAILGGRFDVLEGLAREKERLFAAVLRRPAAADGLDRLKTLADRNRSLLAAMERGVRAASDRLEALSRKPASLHTYDAAGRREAMPGAGAALHRRA